MNAGLHGPQIQAFCDWFPCLTGSAGTGTHDHVYKAHVCPCTGATPNVESRDETGLGTAESISTVGAMHFPTKRRGEHVANPIFWGFYVRLTFPFYLALPSPTEARSN